MGNILKIRVKQDPTSIITGQTAVSGAVNLSAEGLYVQNNNGVLEFKGLQAGANITLTPSSTGITITAAASVSPTGGTPLTLFTGYTASTEVRLSGIEDDIVYLSGQTDTKLNTTLFNSYTASTDTILDAALTGGTSVGGEAIYKQKNGRVLEFKGLVAGTNITLTPSATGITITAAGSVSPTGGTPLTLFTGYTASTETRLQGIESDIVYVSGVTDNKLNTTIFNGYTASTASVLTGLDNDINYLSGQTANKLNTSVFNSYTGSSATILNSAITGVTAGANLAVSQTGRVVDIQFTGSTADPNALTGLTAGVGIGINNTNLKNPVVSFTGSTDYVSNTKFNSYTGTTETRLSGIENDIVYISGVTDTKVNTSSFNSYTGTTATELSNINSELDLAITGVTAGVNLSAVQTGRVVDIQFTGSTGSGGAYLPLSGGTVTGNIILSGSTGRSLEIRGGVGELKDIILSTGANARWIIRSDSSTESGSNAGSDFNIISRDDGGGILFTTLNINRATGRVDVTKGANIYGDIVTLTGNTTLDESHGGRTIECSGTFTLTLPNSMVTGMKVTLVNIGTGIITIAASGTLQSKFSNTKLGAQYAAASAYHAGSNVWRLFGDLNA